MKKAAVRFLEIEELERRTPPSVIFGLFLPGIEVAMDAAVEAAAAAPLSTDALHLSAEIIDLPDAVPVGFEHMGLAYEFSHNDSFRLPDMLHFAQDTPIFHVESAPQTVPFLEGSHDFLNVEPLAIQAEIAAPPTVSNAEGNHQANLNEPQES